MERVLFNEMFVPDRRGFALTFGTEHGQTYASDAAPSAAAEQEEEELALVRLSAPGDNFAVNVVAHGGPKRRARPRTDSVDLITGNVKTAVKVIHNA